MNYTIFKTNNSNTYLYSFHNQQTITLHPVLEFIINKLADNNQDLDFLNQNSIKIENKSYNKDILTYYYNKYLFLKENGFLNKINTKEILSGKIKQEDVETSLNNITNIVFEVTERCNLDCKYCVYGESYTVHSNRKQVDLDSKQAIKTLDYFTKRWLSNNDNFYRKIVVGFYGGEALLKFDTIMTIVDHVKIISKTTGLKFQFNMTTNGVLLDKYINYLVDNDFWLLISLDGNEKNNSYRVFSSNKPSYKKVVSNINLIKEKYPDFYNKNVTFSTVLHDKNEEYQVNDFFLKNFNKKSSYSSIKSLDKKDENLFQNTPIDLFDVIRNEKDYSKFVTSNLPHDFMMFFKNYLGTITNNYSEIINKKFKSKYFPTGTCLPFSKKIFISAQGNIYPCERINFRFVMGRISSKEVDIDTKEVADNYNNYFSKMQKQCSSCYNFIYCLSCFFANIIQEDDSIICSNFISKNFHPNLISNYWKFFEKYPNFYLKSLKKFSYE